MKRSSVLIIILASCLCQGLLGCDKSGSGGTTETADAIGRCPHDIKQDRCPFCTPALIESDGFCGEHGVAEALCYQCRPYLKAAFRAKGDWCAEHEAPESQCVICHPELEEQMKAGEHGTKSTNDGGDS